MAANQFRLFGNPIKVESLEDFLSKGRSEDGYQAFKGILYYPNRFNKDRSKFFKQENKKYKNVSFKGTTFDRVIFENCKFEKCLLLDVKFIDCKFKNCEFVDTNTSGSSFEKTHIDPSYFKNNFDLRQDSNIAIELYHSLYKNSMNEGRYDRARQSLFEKCRAEDAQLNYELSKKTIKLWAFWWRKTWRFFDRLVSGYGLKLNRILIVFTSFILSVSGFNYIFRDEFFRYGDIQTFCDSVYFTLVTLTTLGYGDITPATQSGKIFISIEVVLGIISVSLLLRSIGSRVIRT